MGTRPATPSDVERRLAARWGLVGGFAALVAACADPGRSRSPLALESCRPAPESEPLLLNDDIRLTFSRPLDATTVTENSVRIVDVATGRLARGTWEVEGRRLRFRPEAVLSSTLDEGGYLPGATYELVARGFPHLGAIRTPEGDSLERSISLTFRVVGVDTGDAASGEDDRRNPAVLRDASPGRTAPLRVLLTDPGSAETRPLRWTEPLRIACDEPLDPRTIDPEEFEIRRVGPTDGGPGEESAPIRIARMVLESNRGEDAWPESDGRGARLIVQPAVPLPVRSNANPALFVLQAKAGIEPSLADFSGGRAYRRHDPIEFYVARADRSPEQEDSYELDFTSDLDFVPVLDPASDGTARWAGNGRVEIRYPAAAGDGEDGPITLEGDEPRAEVSAIRLALARDSKVTLTAPGLVVLRAQGRIDLIGRLEREAPSAEPAPMWPEGRRLFTESAKDAESLSEWLLRAREANEPWTVIIAGGDIVATGPIDVKTPLLLAAGGRIRGAGMPRTTPGQLWLLGDGGGFQLPPEANPNVEPPLYIDEPLVNPLVEPLVYVAISSSVPKGRRPGQWFAPLVVGRAGAAGAFDVQYLRADALRRGEEGLGQAVRYDQPNLVMEPDAPGSAPVRLRIELVIEPRSGVWDPPYVDRVRLAWSPDRR
ncbi:MAG: Ig-like domain-containing protein [Planctomycetota bacterium]